MAFMIIGLTGPVGSGKGEVSNILTGMGYVRFSFSDALREKMNEEGIELTRKNMQDFGDNWRKTEGMEILAKMLSDKIMKTKTKYAVIDGFRNPAEVEEFKKFRDFVLIGIDSTPENRFNRLIKRGRENDPKTFVDFKKLDDKDKGVGQEEYGQRSGECFKLAKAYILNNGTVEQLKDKVVKLVKELEK